MVFRVPHGLPRVCSFIFIYLICHTLNPSPSAGRVRGLKESIHLSSVHALHFRLADWVSTPAPRQFTTKELRRLFTHVLTLSTVGIRHYEEKIRRIWNRTLNLPTLRRQSDPYTAGERWLVLNLY